MIVWWWALQGLTVVITLVLIAEIIYCVGFYLRWRRQERRRNL